MNIVIFKDSTYGVLVTNINNKPEFLSASTTGTFTDVLNINSFCKFKTLQEARDRIHIAYQFIE